MGMATRRWLTAALSTVTTLVDPAAGGYPVTRHTLIAVGYGWDRRCGVSARWPDLEVLELLVAVAEVGSMAGVVTVISTRPAA